MHRLRMPVVRVLDRLGVVGATSHPVAPYGHDFAANDLHVDEDTICPRCLTWIAPEDIVRRTAFGPAQHEACPHQRAWLTTS
jgi:hypothetical protein